MLTFGLEGEVTWRAVELDDLGRPTFELGHAGEWHAVGLQQSGAHQVANATAAAAMAVAVGRPVSQVAAALSEAQAASRWRMELHERADGMLVVNDAYNANPASMVAAITTLAEIGERRRIAGPWRCWARCWSSATTTSPLTRRSGGPWPRPAST